MPVRKPSPLDLELGAFLKKKMEEKNWSYPMLSKETGVPIALLHGLTSGQQSTSLHTTFRIMENLGVGLNDIFPDRVK